MCSVNAPALTVQGTVDWALPRGGSARMERRVCKMWNRAFPDTEKLVFRDLS